MAYNSEKAPSDPDIADTASSGFFSSDFKKHGDLKSMLDGPKDNLKLEAMKRIISMMADGRDVSELFPAVVKNVVSKNVEIKKLVYVYLVRYAEEQQDLALLSISTFQKGLKDPNQLIRASALRVLSSIRVPVIAPIMMLSIKEGVSDMSPFVRKTAAHAIPKLYSLDPDQKDCLIEVIEKLLKDKTTLVAGSAVMAFEEVCPDRIDLIHKNYRKLCNLLVDIDEWGQVAVIHMLTRYARTQFLDPNKDSQGIADEAFYSKSDESSAEEAEEEENEKNKKKEPYIMDPDHRLLLRTCKPLLQSRNSAVVMAVARLYHHCAPTGEVGVVARALVRLLRSHKEVQTVVLSNVATMSAHRKGMFEPHLKSFFVHANDPTHIRLLKLEIMTNVAGETSIGTILREFQSYITSSDKQFVASTIQAIGRCASNISEVTDTCLAGLVRLLSNRDEVVVAESVVVIKKLLQLKPKGNSDIIAHMARLVDGITVPMARASILWLLGEYAERVPKIAPDVLRKMAKTFATEEDIVKLQVLNLATKLAITNPKQAQLLCQYVFNLGKYDQNYDVRDRVRFLRQLILPNELAGQLSKHTKKIFLASKPPPVIESVFKERHSFQLGSLSHMINAKSNGYQELPDFPETAPDSSVRNVEVEPAWGSTDKTKKLKNKIKKTSFYSDSGSSESESESGSESESETGSGSDSEGESESGSGLESSSETASESESEADSITDSDKEEDSEWDSEESSEKTSESESEEEEEVIPKKVSTSKMEKNKIEPKKESSSKNVQNGSLDQLLDLNDVDATSNFPATPKSGAILTPSLASEMESLSLCNDVSTNLAPVAPSFTPGKSFELLHRMTGKGLSATYKFTRSPCIYSTTMVSVEVVFTNTTNTPISNIHIGEQKLGFGMKMHEFQEIGSLAPGASIAVTLGIDFKDTTQPAKFDLCTKTESKFPVSIKPPTGELLKGCKMSEQDFLSLQAKLRGMNESCSSVDIPSSKCDKESILRSVTEVANVSFISCTTGNDALYRFAAKTVSQGVHVLVTVKVSTTGEPSSVTVNCETMVISSMLVKELKSALQ